MSGMFRHHIIVIDDQPKHEAPKPEITPHENTLYPETRTFCTQRARVCTRTCTRTGGRHDGRTQSNPQAKNQQIEVPLGDIETYTTNIPDLRSLEWVSNSPENKPPLAQVHPLGTLRQNGFPPEQQPIPPLQTHLGQPQQPTPPLLFNSF